MNVYKSNPEYPARLEGEQNWELALDRDVLLRGFLRPGEGGCAGVFLHGFRSHCDGAKARRLSRWAASHGKRWLRFDQRGCGFSSGEFRWFTVSGAIDDTHRSLDALGEAPYVLVGSSLGALIAIHVATTRRHRIEGLVLIAPALNFPQQFIGRQVNERGLESWKHRGYRWFPDLYAGGCFRLDYGFCTDALRYEGPPNELPCPVRVIHGSRDELLPLQDSRDWLARLDCPSKALEIVEGGDHRLTEWSDTIALETQILFEEIDHSCV